MEVGERAARRGATELLKWRRKITPREKGPRDLVTEADLASQEAIYREIRTSFPHHELLGEEDPVDMQDRRVALDGYCWIIDPLDGTTNFVHDLPNFSVSIGLMHAGAVIAGAVYDPLLDEMFSAGTGLGAKLNGDVIRCSNCSNLEQALIASSFGTNVPRGSVEVARFIEVLHTSQAVRRLGSAALNLSYVAAGRLDGYWATNVKIWDIAAGFVIASEAGVTISGLEDAEVDLYHPRFVASATPTLHEELKKTLKDAVRPAS